MQALEPLCLKLAVLQIGIANGVRGDRESFCENFHESSWNKFDFAHRSDAVARSGSRELRAVKIPASYDAWRPPKRQKTDSVKIRCFRSRK